MNRIMRRWVRKTILGLPISHTTIDRYSPPLAQFRVQNGLHRVALVGIGVAAAGELDTSERVFDMFVRLDDALRFDLHEQARGHIRCRR